jgi:hypothetical protein
MAGDRHFAQAARAWCEKALARLLPDLDRGASCPAFKRTPSVKQLSALPTAEPSSPAHPIHNWTLSPVKALLKAGVVGAGGVEPPSSSVSDPTNTCRPVRQMVGNREGSSESCR